MRYIDRYEPPPEQGCFLCGGKSEGEHWSICPFGQDHLSDDDPDADNPEQSVEFL